MNYKLVISLFLVIVTSGAQAQTQAQTQPINKTVILDVSNNNSGNAVTKTTYITLKKIDPAHSVITSGTISFSFTTSYSGVAYNFEPQTLSCVATGTTTQTLTAPVSGTSASGSTAMFALAYDVPAYRTESYTNLNGLQTSASSTINLSAADLAAFYGVGTVNLVLTTQQTSQVEVLGGFFSNSAMGSSTNVVSEITGTLTLNTAPAATPELSSFDEMALGIGMIGLVGWRKSRFSGHRKSERAGEQLR